MPCYRVFLSASQFSSAPVRFRGVLLIPLSGVQFVCKMCAKKQLNNRIEPTGLSD